MRHLNRDLMCSITILTTGPDPKQDDIVGLCCAPLDWNLNVHSKIRPFCANMQLRRGGIDKDFIKGDKQRIVESLKKGIDAYQVLDMWEEWKEQNVTPKEKRIVPLVYNWPNIRDYLIDWMGTETFKYMFQEKVRDILVIANYLDDKADSAMVGLPYPKPEDFIYVCNCCHVDFKWSMDIKKEALAVVGCYKNMLTSGYIISGERLSNEKTTDNIVVIDSSNTVG